MNEQQNLLEAAESTVKNEEIILFALGDFQSRGKVLAMRELALDRLRGAFKRASEKFGVDELGDDQIAETLENLGAKVKKVPSFVAKHPYRVTISEDIANKGKEFYENTLEND
ncbi:MAG TPA: hypothetical protein PKY59_18055 [Pyrinomonadaceae bacterium]|nr:hypothetical protein [Pyrinomonadaceae bacterium]